MNWLLSAGALLFLLTLGGWMYRRRQKLTAPPPPAPSEYPEPVASSISLPAAVATAPEIAQAEQVVSLPLEISHPTPEPPQQAEPTTTPAPATIVFELPSPAETPVAPAAAELVQEQKIEDSGPMEDLRVSDNTIPPAPPPDATAPPPIELPAQSAPSPSSEEDSEPIASGPKSAPSVEAPAEKPAADPATRPPMVAAPLPEAEPESEQKVPRYRAPTTGTRAPRPRAPRPPVNRPSTPTSASDLEIRARARLHRGGHLEFALLFARPAGFPEQLVLELGGHETGLEACNEDWYEAPPLADLGSHLSNGLAVSYPNNGQNSRWALSAGRVFYVFAHEAGLGWASQTRLKLGRPQIILCTPDWQENVQRALVETGVAESPRLGRAGVLDGWIAFGPIAPSRSVSPVEGDNLGNLLRPLPEVEISFDDGLWLRGNTWLAGFPPSIRVTGEIPAGESVLIDSVPATRDAAGGFTAPGFDTTGDHQVYLAGKSAGYTIAEPPDHWADAPPITSGDAHSEFAAASSVTTGRLFSTRMTHRMLIGPKPGQIFICPQRFGSTWTGFVPFEPAWAVPADPLHCDRTSLRILPCHPQPVVQLRQPSWRDRAQPTSGVHRWVTALLDCSRKGLKLDPASNPELWASYLKEARQVRQLLR